MPIIKSLEELRRLREETLQKRQNQAISGQVQVIVALGSCGIAAGANNALISILDFIERNRDINVTVTQTGCLGLCEHEPIVQIVAGNRTAIMYGRVNAQVAEKIMKQHVQNGQPVKENIIRV